MDGFFPGSEIYPRLESNFSKDVNFLLKRDSETYFKYKTIGEMSRAQTVLCNLHSRAKHRGISH